MNHSRRRGRQLLLALWAITWLGSTSIRAAAPAATAEQARRSAWVESHLQAKPGRAPGFFSFVYGGQPSSTRLSAWTAKTAQSKLDAHRTAHILTWTDPTTGLTVQCRAVVYDDYPTVEWTLFLENTGRAATPLIENLLPLDLRLEREQPGEFMLHHHTGDNYSAHSYEPHATPLEPSSTHRFAPDGGRPTNGAYPYYNLAYDGGGLIAVIGWPGQWSSRFERDAARGLRVSGGQELTHFKLLPGERVRSPLVVLQFWEGDRVRAQNVWRRWMVAQNLPRTGGQLPPPFTSACMGLHQSEQTEVAFIDSYADHNTPLNYWWMDAGWYPCRDWPETGTWEPDPARFPRGIRAVSDHAHARGMKLVLWFEPERVHAGSWLFVNHPEWTLGKGGDRLVNLGNPAAQRWLTDHIDHFLTNQGIDLYRQDFNIDPLSFWRGNDAPDRQGITEIRHVEGYLAFWDELRKHHPDLLIDSCASGGRRNDLETLRRAVPLLRSDYQAPQNPGARDMLVGNQGHTYGLSSWVPYYGTGVFYNDVYAFRSHLTPSLGIGYSGDPAQVDWTALRRRFDDWKQVAGDFYGDYYPLTPHSLTETDWIAWQFDRPEASEGMIQAFRRTRCEADNLVVKLRGLDASAVYEVRDLDKDSPTRSTGRSLMETGLRIALAHRLQAALLKYRRVSGIAAVATATLAACEVGQSVAFSGADSRPTAGGAVVAYRWVFGDGHVAEGSRVEHAFTQPGEFTVKLTVRDARGQADTIATPVTVEPRDTTPPTIVAVASGRRDRVVVTFSEPVERRSASDRANYTIEPGVALLAAELAHDSKTVTLTTAPFDEGKTYTLSVRRIRDRARTPHTIAEGTRRLFQYTGLYAWWKLDDGQGDTAVDTSGNGRHGLVQGARWQSGGPGPALHFDGHGQFVETDTSLADLAIPFTITAWVNPGPTQVEYADIWGNHGEPFVGVSLQQELTHTNVFTFGFGNGQRWYGAGPARLEAGRWQHVAVVCDGHEAALLVDGVVKSRQPAAGPLAPNPSQNFKLGQGYHSGRYFNGRLRDVRIYSRALSDPEVAALVKASR